MVVINLILDALKTEGSEGLKSLIQSKFADRPKKVRNLAMRAGEAAQNTSVLVEGIVHKIQDGTGVASKTKEAFSEVADQASKMGELIGEIAVSSNEQTKGIHHMGAAVK